METRIPQFRTAPWGHENECESQARQTNAEVFIDRHRAFCTGDDIGAPGSGDIRLATKAAVDGSPRARRYYLVVIRRLSQVCLLSAAKSWDILRPCHWRAEYLLRSGLAKVALSAIFSLQ